MSAGPVPDIRACGRAAPDSPFNVVRRRDKCPRSMASSAVRIVQVPTEQEHPFGSVVAVVVILRFIVDLGVECRGDSGLL